jgi:hypothetical protein
VIPGLFICIQEVFLHIYSNQATQYEIWHKIKHYDPKLENCHAGIVNRIEILEGNIEPPAMQAIHPVVCKNEEKKP